MNEIHDAIATRLDRLADLERKAEKLRDELAALKKAADILGVNVQTSLSPTIANPSKRGGKPVGAISKSWRAVLEYLAANGDRHSLADVKAVADLYDLKGELSSVRDRLRNFALNGFIIKNPDDTYSVTQEAVEKFGFSNATKEIAAPSEEGAAQS